MTQIDPQLQGDFGFSEKSWEYAAAFADSLGALPGSVSSIIRLLLCDYDKDPHNLSSDTKFLFKRFLKSRSFQAPYFHSVAMFKPERLLPADEPFTPRDFLESFSGPEHAFLIGMIFLNRQAKALCDEAMFENATACLQRGLNVGWLVGKTLRPVGTEAGLFTGSYKWLGIIPFLRHDPEGFKLYSRHLRKRDFGTTDLEFETARWECTSSQVGIMLLQRMGFGVNRLVPLMRATTTISAAAPSDALERRYRAAEVWIRYILENRKFPSVPLPPSLYLKPEEIEDITRRLLDGVPAKIRNWLSCTSRDVSPTSTPQLFLEDPNKDNGGAEEAENGELAATLNNPALAQDENLESFLEDRARPA